MATKKLKQLTDWDWTTLVAAWRYYQYRSTIVSATFPQNIYERYFTGEYAPEDCFRIAYQFYSVDHGRDGEADWQGQSVIDAKPWTAFFAFCKAYCEGFARLRLKDGSIHEAFYCETFKRWIPRKRYRGDADVSIADDRIVKVESGVLSKTPKKIRTESGEVKQAKERVQLVGLPEKVHEYDQQFSELPF